MELLKKMTLNQLVEKQISESGMRNIVGGEPGVPCTSKCGSDATANVNQALKSLKVNNPTTPQP